MSKKKSKGSGIWMSAKGEVACAEHAPPKGSDSRKEGRWRELSATDVEEFKRQLGREPACETCASIAARAGRSADAEAESVAPDANAAAPDAAEGSDAPAEPKKKGRKTKADLTLADLAERYVAHLEEAGKSSGTSASYGLELKTALGELGAQSRLADLTTKEVQAYFASPRVTRKKNGKHKSPLSISKTQRVLRLALVWAVSAKLIEKAPLPETLATH